MADVTSTNSKTTIARALGLKAKAQTLPPLTDDELHEEAIARAISGTAQLRRDARDWKARAEEAEHELNIRKHEHEAKLVGLRQENELLRKQISDIGAKMERHLRGELEMVTKANDLEMFYLAEMARIHEAGSMAANSLTIAVNASCNVLKQFLDDLHAKRQRGAPRPTEESEENNPIPDFLAAGPAISDEDIK